jgi:transcriptional antiterminator NusG
MHKWYVVQVKSSHEKKVKKNIEDGLKKSGMEDLVGEVLVPTENVAEVKKGAQKVVERNVWPGYILVNMTMTDDAWMQIQKTDGVIGFLGGDKAMPLPESEVNAILSELEEKRKGVTQKHNIQISDHVKINDGPFVNFKGVVQKVNAETGKLNVSVSIFGRETIVQDLEFSQVELQPLDTDK